MLLVTIVGPIASGKSTIAEELGRALRKRGRSVAVVDLDDVVEGVGGFSTLTAERFRDAQLVLGDLVASWLRRDVDVIAHGPFFHPEEDAALVHAVPAETTVRRVRLHTTYEVALERVSVDPARALSKNPALVRLTYDRVADLLPVMAPADWEFDTTQTSVDQVVATLVSELPDTT